MGNTLGLLLLESTKKTIQIDYNNAYIIFFFKSKKNYSYIYMKEFDNNAIICENEKVMIGLNKGIRK